MTTTKSLESSGALHWEGRILEAGWWVAFYSRGKPFAYEGPFEVRSQAESYALEIGVL